MVRNRYVYIYLDFYHKVTTYTWWYAFYLLVYFSREANFFSFVKEYYDSNYYFCVGLHSYLAYNFLNLNFAHMDFNYRFEDVLIAFCFISKDYDFYRKLNLTFWAFFVFYVLKWKYNYQI